MSNPSNSDAAKSAGERIREHTTHAAKTMEAARAAGASSGLNGLGGPNAAFAGPMADALGALQNLNASGNTTELIRSLLTGAAQIKQRHPLDGGCQTETIVVKCLDILTIFFTQQVGEVATLKNQLEAYRAQELEQIKAASRAESAAELAAENEKVLTERANRLIAHAVDIAKTSGASPELAMLAQFIAREAGQELSDDVLRSLGG